MSVINILDKNTINQIAAGEVIERPASVVKELIENAIDAGATAVSCEIKGGGIDLIRITDNGSGFDPDDVRVAFLRHATSKIKDASDLQEVMSLGFRGEALASIAAVARVELLTRQKTSVYGIRYVIEGGEELAYENVGCPEGTTFIIRDLFANVPVRRKFLKSAMTEGSYVTELIERIAVSHPGVSIKYTNNDKVMIFTSGNNSIKDIIYGIYGREITASLIEVDDECSGISVSGCIARPVVARSNRNLENYFVNGRYIRSNVISKAIEDAFAPFMMQHKYPFTVLCLSIPALSMDVNVHPTKQEVRFEHPEEVYNAVCSTISRALRNALLIPSGDTPEEDTSVDKKTVLKEFSERNRTAPEPFEAGRRAAAAPKTDDEAENSGPVLKTDMNPRPEPVQQTEPVQKPDTVQSPEPIQKPDTVQSPEPIQKPDSAQSSEPINKPEPVQESKPVQMVFDTNIDNSGTVLNIRPETSREFREGLNDGYRIAGQVFNTYWIIERGNEMYLIDQHAAHEKVIFEKLMNSRDEDTAASQELFPAIVISLSASECRAVEDHMEELNSIGYSLESFGGREYAVTGVPVNIYSIDPKNLLLELIASFEEAGHMTGRVSLSMKERLATCACKAAVKGNNRISPKEAEELIRQLLTLDNPFNCPHGRPVIISMTKSELEKKFKRIV